MLRIPQLWKLSLTLCRDCYMLLGLHGGWEGGAGGEAGKEEGREAVERWETS